MEKEQKRKNLISYAYYLAFALLLFVLYRTAWLSDDAFISYRCLDNFMQGEGLTFNPGHRVQAYTHPLWLFLHTPFRLIFKEIYYLGLFVSLGCSLLCIWVLLRSISSSERKLYVMLLLISSAAFIDYSSSGLENPLTHLLMICTALLYLKEEQSSQKSFLLAFLSALMLLNRMDSILLVLPLLCIHLWENRKLKTLLLMLLGISPFIIWEIFALIYYGFPFPMTAYAKLNISNSRQELLVQGFYYFQDLFKNDPLTALIILSGLSLPFIQKNRRLFALAMGIALYLLYILYIGGDFMRARFFTAPFFLAILILQQTLEVIWQRRMIPLVLFLACLSHSPPILSMEDFGRKVNDIDPETFHGILDEREYYFQKTGLIATKSGQRPRGIRVEEGKKLRQSKGKVYLASNMGMMSYFAGAEKHIIDIYALSDPFLAQLPNVYQKNWRPGHNKRIIPSGLIESYVSGGNQLEHPQLKELYGAIYSLSQAPIWSIERFKTIAAIHLGDRYQKLIDREYFHLPVSRSLSEQELQAFDQQLWELHPDGGLEIRLARNRSLSLLELEAQIDCGFSLVFLRGDKIIDSAIINSGARSKRDLRVVLPVPLEELDRIIIYPNIQSQSCQIRGIKLT